jgi:tetratricopeptide (TPR) repeat protein
LDGLDSCAEAESIASEAAARADQSDQVNLAGTPLDVSRRLATIAGGFGWLYMASALAAPTVGTFAGPMVRFIDTQELEDHADISIEFACSVRYVTNVPASHGESTKITLRLGPDCGPQLSSVIPELPLVGGGGQLVTGARVDSILPGEMTLELTWSRPLDFVMAPTASGIGLRVRLLNTNRRKGNAFVADGSAPAEYAVNLESSRVRFGRDQVEAAAAGLQAQAYVSETDVEEAHWYRLRVGPFTSRGEAERVLKIAQARYPRAWLAIDDEQTDLSVIDRAGVPSSPLVRRTDAVLPDTERTAILNDARAALEAHRYPEAVDLLSRLQRQPEYPARADAQELLGLARERAGQLAQAKAEYREYLQQYPQGAGAARVRARLQALAQASLAATSTGDFGSAARNRLTFAGSAAISYQYGRDQSVSAGTTTTTNSVNSALVYGDLLLRERGQRYDFTARVDAGYTHNLQTTFGGSQDRTTAAYAELSDRLFGVTARLGRQSLAAQGVVGLFDGIFVGYQINPTWSMSAAAGLPAYTSYSQVSSQQKFGTLTAEFDPFQHRWVFDAYLFDETNGGATERRSVGLQTRYSAAGRTAVVLADYDIAFRQLNSATLIGNSKVGSWVIGFDADHRRSPLLELSNALIGQSVTDLQILETQLTPSQLRSVALDRTATSNTAVLSANRSLGERWQFMADIGALELTGTPATAPLPGTQLVAVPATPSTGVDKNASLQLAGASLLQASDLHIFSVRFDDSPTSRSVTLSWDARFALPGAWRLGPRLSVEQLNDPTLGGRQMLYLPQLRGDWTNRFSVFEIIAGYQVMSQQALQQQQASADQPVSSAIEQRSLYASAAYRLRF